MASKRPRVALRKEDQPTHEQVELISRIEDLGWREETVEEYAARLADWRRRRAALEKAGVPAGTRAAALDALGPEPDVDDLVPNQDVTTFDGMSLEAYAAMLLQVLPGKLHGFHHGLPASSPTAARPGSAEKLAVFRRRLARGEDLHHPNDNKRRAFDRLIS
jgi:hypothetical protein